MSSSRHFDVVVVGAGPAGLASALAIARLGIRAALVGSRASLAPSTTEQRTAALFAGSIELIRNLAVWETLATASEPITAIRIVDDMGGLLRAPEVLFPASEVGRDALGWNIPNAALVAALLAAVRASESNLTIIETEAVERLEPSAEAAVLHLSDGAPVTARLVVGADGRASVCRAGAGIASKAWSYPQAALACAFAHERPHHGVSTELHRPVGPCTTVPMPVRRSSLVWVEDPEEARRLAALDPLSFAAALETRLKGLLGSVSDVGRRAVFPLAGLTAERAAGNRVALVGEAAHVIPPIGAQGLNLGFRDVATLADCVADAIRAGGDPGAPETLAAYASARRLDIATRVTGVDLLNRTLLWDTLPPVRIARGLGLLGLAVIGPLRRLVMREGLAPSGVAPTLLQPGGAALFAARLRGEAPDAAA